jgi:hypothetical protein
MTEKKGAYPNPERHLAHELSTSLRAPFGNRNAWMQILPGSTFRSHNPYRDEPL